MIPSYFLIKRFEEEFPRRKVKLVVGADLLPTLKSWDEGAKLINECNFFVLPRIGFSIPEEFRSRINFEVMPETYEASGESSTMIREILARGTGAELQALLQRPVLDYIIQHHLYENRLP